MFKNRCAVCKVFGIIAVVGTLNWGLVGLLNLDLVAQIFGYGTLLSRLVYILVGISGVFLLINFFKECPKCKKA